MTEEHVPPTDEELAEWDAKYDFDDGVVRCLIAEVRRLRPDPKFCNLCGTLARCYPVQDRTVCGECIDKAFETRKCFDVRCDDELNPPEKLEQGYMTAEISMCPYFASQLKQLSLTLPNGTVVRAGDVFAHVDYDTPLTVTAVGRHSALAVNEKWSPAEKQIDERFFELFLRPWSEVYPDRPVPGAQPPAAEETDDE